MGGPSFTTGEEKTMDGYTVVEVVVIVDENGDYAIGVDAASAAEKYAEDFTDEGQARRVIRATINVPTPKPVELTATVAEESAAGELKVA